MKELYKKFLAVIVFFILLASVVNVHANIEQNRAEAIAWLLENQNGDGSWGLAGAKTASTSEALQALQNSGLQNSFMYSKALSWLANSRADSLDSLARKMIALEKAGMNTSNMGLYNTLLSYRNSSKAWGSSICFRLSASPLSN